ncbi:MAG: hypothetical protein EOO17_05675 [Chloroflexi bacterium]|nr:MAG: hypothetical protein EOO17_05675 [Chloroflexota bacterium]
MNDKTTFDKLWSYEQSHLDRNGLMHWRINADGSVAGHNAATDADEDMAIALVAAAQRWGGDYKAKAVTLINAIMKYEVEAGTNILKPGDEWGGSDVLNPSYISPSYYPIFAEVTGNSRWNAVQSANYTVLANVDAKSGSKTTGLVPDWSNAAGYQTNGMSYDYGYDAVRSPLRMAMSASWDCDPTAIARLKATNAFFESKGPSSIVDRYTTSGTPLGGYHSPGFIGAAATASLVSQNATYKNAIWNELVSTNGGGYYHESIRLFSLLIASGKMVSPLELPSSTTSTPPPVVTPTPPSNPLPETPVIVSNLDVWWPVDGATVVGTQPFKVMMTNQAVEDYTMYWQVDGGVLNQMGNNYESWPHKQVDVNVSNWKWQPTGKYKITFVAKDSLGRIITTKSSIISVAY